MFCFHCPPSMGSMHPAARLGMDYAHCPPNPCEFFTFLQVTSVEQSHFHFLTRALTGIIFVDPLSLVRLYSELFRGIMFRVNEQMA